MELPDAAVRFDWACAVPDGGLYRKAGLVEFLKHRAPERFHELVIPTGGSRGRRTGRALLALMRFALATRARSILFFYPALPLFHPPAGRKLPALAIWLATVRRALARRGVKIVLDVEDLPAAQHLTLTGRPHPAGDGVLARAERWLSRFADEVWLPSEALADRWRQVSAAPGRQVRVVPTGAPAQLPAAPPGPGQGVRFLCAASLYGAHDRGVSWLLERFTEGAAPSARLLLAGPGGEWIPGRYPRERVEWVGALDRSELESLAVGADWGLVPYPERGYFHLAFPAKLALYTSCGLPVLTTAARTAAEAVRAAGVGRVSPADSWARTLGELSLAGRPARVECPWLWQQVLG
ncbi:MAG: glycosyltransferase [Candidatus Wallbacteria bacterium]|nr:glycosyltransferase [Candidatus Wallbacteria bacterium]